jgi:hypothetical protein
LKYKIYAIARLVEGKRIMILRISPFVSGIKIVQLDKICEIEDTAVLLVFLKVFDKISEFKQFIQELT